LLILVQNLTDTSQNQPKDGIIVHHHSAAPLRLLDEEIQERIVDTYAKLDPKELMFYWENLYNYPKKRLIADIRIRHPYFSRDLESLQAAIQAAMLERPWLDDSVYSATHPICGIIDLGDERDVERELLKGDASSDGSLPASANFVQPGFEYPCTGDDGSKLDESAYRYSRNMGRAVENYESDLE
jgi:hypothetical protein